jgi:hypothetical protein
MNKIDITDLKIILENLTGRIIGKKITNDRIPLIEELKDIN